ncbi:MAG: hypothetical protein WDO13_18715 [Verrucomicrobiota bacterium]
MKPNPDPLDPLLQAVLADEAWNEACDLTRTRAGACLRRRRLWRAARGPLAGGGLVLLAAAGWAFAVWAPRHQDSGVRLPAISAVATTVPDAAPASVRLGLSLPPAPHPDSFTLCLYRPEPAWPGLTPLAPGAPNP